MKNKLGITVLAAVMALAGLREASEQFDALKSSAADWTRTSILGNLLVFAADGAVDAGTPRQPSPVPLAKTYLACHGEESHSAPSRPASTTKPASAEHAKLIERSSRAQGAGELAMRFAVTARGLSTSQAKSREQFVVKVAPAMTELAKAFGAELTDDAAGAVRVRESDEARAAHTRAVAELKKLGLKRVFVRVARFNDADMKKNVFAFRLPELLPTPFDLKSLASLGDEPEPTTPVAPISAPSATTPPDATFDFKAILNIPSASNTSFNCDSDPLG